jgi:hypothetical protein
MRTSSAMKGGTSVKHLSKLTGASCAVLTVAALASAIAFAQQATSQSEHEAHHAAAASPEAPGKTGMRPIGAQGMMGGNQMSGMPMMPCAGMGGGVMGMEMMMGGGKNTAMAAKMMEMHAEMMKANAAIMEKYAKELESRK